jgi:hypothetical protein
MLYRDGADHLTGRESVSPCLFVFSLPRLIGLSARRSAAED